jgi:hypothetical protein
MITKIPEGQICQSFDPMMFLPEKTLNIINVTQNANTSCVAPAYVYIEGTHGKKFLCDYHYYYEMNMTRTGGNEEIAASWREIQQFIIDERERVKETFAKNVTTSETLGLKCSIYSTHKPSLICTADAFVKVTPTKYVEGKINFTKTNEFDNNPGILYCNFHFRKNYYRYYSNGVRYEDVHDILDERYRMNMTIAEESSNLQCI